jgi:hypothetical protein
MLKIARNHHNCLDYEIVQKIFYFHILNINGWSSPLEHHHKFLFKKKTLKTTFLFPQFAFLINIKLELG